jgi:hypothetical protein
MVRLRETGRVADRRFDVVMRRYLRLGAVLLMLLVAIVALMTFKPS